MSVLVIYTKNREPGARNPDFKSIAKALREKFIRPTEPSLTVVDLSEPNVAYADLFSANYQYLLLGPKSLEFFHSKLPECFKAKQLNYGQECPKLFILDRSTGFTYYSLVLHYPEAYTGKDVFDAASFLYESYSLRDRLVAQQATRAFAPHESSIFSVKEGESDPLPSGQSCAKVSQFAGQQVNSFGRILDPPIGKLPF